MKQRTAGVFVVLIMTLALSPSSPAFERHPHIAAALEALRAAKGHLESAAHDYHGHRVEAVKHVDEAIREAEICMKED